MKLDAYLRSHQETEAEFAERAGIGRATVSRVKKNGAGSIKVLRKVVAACGGQVTEDDLLCADALEPALVGAKRRRKRKAA